MREVIFRKKAKEDLLAIQAWFEQVAPDSVERILADIHRSIDRVREHPESAQKAYGRNYRRIVTRRYSFKIAYLVKPGLIDILGIYRYQNRER